MVDWHAALGKRPRAGASLIAERDTQQRSESKFVVPEEMAAAFVHALPAHYAVLPAGAALVARYRSLYFDTDDLSFYHAHRRRRRVRQKVRIRHYPDRELSVLEVKIRHGGHADVKRRRRREYGNSTFGGDDLAFVRQHCEPTGDLMPQAWVAYRRTTLVGQQWVERVTIDTDMEVWRASGHARFRNAAIIEVKQPRFSHASEAMQLLRAMGGRRNWMSKYCAAIAFTTPGVRVSHLMDRLRALKAVGTWTN